MENKWKIVKLVSMFAIIVVIRRASIRNNEQRCQNKEKEVTDSFTRTTSASRELTKLDSTWELGDLHSGVRALAKAARFWEECPGKGPRCHPTAVLGLIWTAAGPHGSTPSSSPLSSLPEPTTIATRVKLRRVAAPYLFSAHMRLILPVTRHTRFAPILPIFSRYFTETCTGHCILRRVDLLVRCSSTPIKGIIPCPSLSSPHPRNPIPSLAFSSSQSKLFPPSAECFSLSIISPLKEPRHHSLH